MDTRPPQKDHIPVSAPSPAGPAAPAGCALEWPCRASEINSWWRAFAWQRGASPRRCRGRRARLGGQASPARGGQPRFDTVGPARGRLRPCCAGPGRAGCGDDGPGRAGQRPRRSRGSVEERAMAYAVRVMRASASRVPRDPADTTTLVAVVHSHSTPASQPPPCAPPAA